MVAAVARRRVQIRPTYAAAHNPSVCRLSRVALDSRFLNVASFEFQDSHQQHSVSALCTLGLFDAFAKKWTASAVSNEQLWASFRQKNGRETTNAPCCQSFCILCCGRPVEPAFKVSRAPFGHRRKSKKRTCCRTVAVAASLAEAHYAAAVAYAPFCCSREARYQCKPTVSFRIATTS